MDLTPDEFEASEPVIIKTEVDLVPESSDWSENSSPPNETTELPKQEPNALLSEFAPPSKRKTPPHKCYLCVPVATQLESKDSLHQHLQTTHSALKTFLCTVCNKTFRRMSVPGFNSHLARHDTVSRPFPCTRCPLRFSENKQLKQHALVHYDNSGRLKPASAPCSKCGLNGCRRHNRPRPKVPSVGRTFKCYLCKPEINLPDKEGLQLHLLEDHPRQDLYRCAECNAFEEKVYSYNLHLSRHDAVLRPFRCNICCFRFFRREALRDHEAQLHGVDNGRLPPENKPPRVIERKLACPTCGKRFPFESRLKLHQQTVHRDLMDQAMGFTVEYLKFRCFLCTDTHFSTKDRKELLEHLKATHPRQPSYQCGECDYTSRTMPLFNSHMARHDSTSRPFKCKFCPLRLFDKKQRICHELAAHDYDNGRTTFPCTSCGKKFAYGPDLARHEAKGPCGLAATVKAAEVKTKKEFICAHCGKKLARGFTLKRHLQMAHGVSSQEGIEEKAVDVKVEPEDEEVPAEIEEVRVIVKSESLEQELD